MNTTQTNGPSIKCPGCGFIISLPAEICPQCHFNLRSGMAAPVEEADAAGGSHFRLLLAGAALLFVTAAALGIIFFSSKDQPPAQNKSALPENASSLEEALDNIEHMHNKPIGARPGAIINSTQDIADQVSKKNLAGDPALEAPEGQ